MVTADAAVYSGEEGHVATILDARQPSAVRPVTPALFVSHGAPTAALDDDAYTQALAAWAAARAKPAAVVVLSAHAEAPGPLRVNAAPRPQLVYDFYGFPAELYALRYDAPGSPELAQEIAESLGASGIEIVLDTRGGWDHGLWVPLRRLCPAADVPVVALSLPVPRTPQQLVRVGEALRPLRERGVLLFGSGGVVHNLGQLRWSDVYGAPEPWAAAFDRWVGEKLVALDVVGLAAYGAQAPNARLAVPTSEHFDPLFFVLGAVCPGEEATTVYEGFRYGTLSLRSFALGAA